MEASRPSQGDRRAPVVGPARLAGLAAGLGLAANGLWLALTANLTLGTALVGGVSVALLLWAGWHHRLPRPALWNGAVAGLCLAVVVMGAYLAAVGTSDDATHEEDAVIVLGAAVHGSELSRTLRGRLDTALGYHRLNPGSLVVVTGGQGPQEDLPESVAMARYLVAAGVPEEQLVVEDRSTSTEENFAFAKALLDRKLGRGYRVAFVTDEFHVYRAGRIAAAVGLVATHVSSRTPWYFWPSNYLRETVAVAASWVSQPPG